MSCRPGPSARTQYADHAAAHILPNVAATYIVLMTITLGFAIVVEASLSFLGVGVPEGVATWGSMLEIGREHIHTQAWLVVFPGIIIAAVVFAVNFLGDGLRDVLDPSSGGASRRTAGSARHMQHICKS